MTNGGIDVYVEGRKIIYDFVIPELQHFSLHNTMHLNLKDRHAHTHQCGLLYSEPVTYRNYRIGS